MADAALGGRGGVPSATRLGCMRSPVGPSCGNKGRLGGVFPGIHMYTGRTTMDIGREIRTYTVEPIHLPTPAEAPAEAPTRPPAVPA